MKELYTAAGIFVVLILLGVWMVQNNRNEQEKKLVQLRKKWGKKQEKRTAREKKEKLEACLRRKAGENFCVDAITWNDLDLDAVFDTVDHTVSVCGEEYLYTALRMPVTTTEIREERERLMKLFAENQKAREAVQKALLLMGKEKMNPPTEEIAVLMEAEPGEKGKYLLMAGIAVLGIGLLFALPPLGVAVLFASMVGNGLMHGRESKKLESALKAFGCILRLQRTARELGKEKISGLEMYQKRLEEQEKQLRPITRKCRTLVNTKESQGGAVKLSNEEVAVRVIHGGVGAINESDVMLATASSAIIIGFNVRPDANAKSMAEQNGVDIRLYRVIYQAIEDVEAAMKGMLEPVYEEKVIGHAEVRQLFKASGVGTIAGSYVLDGTFQRGCKVRISREGNQIFEGNLASLKRFKDDVKEVRSGYECGLVFEGFNDLQEFDQVEAYIMVEVPR